MLSITLGSLLFKRGRFCEKLPKLCKSSLHASRIYNEASGDKTLVKSVDKTQDVPPEEFRLRSFNQIETIPENPIKSLDLVKKISKVTKKGSFTVDLFMGKYDEDFLIYPEVVENRGESEEIKQQADMVYQIWPQMWDDERQLQKFNFFQLYQLSVSEMMTIFESIGKSTVESFDNPYSTETNPLAQQSKITKSIMSLITRNCMTYRALDQSDNEILKRYLPNRHIITGGMSTAKESDIYPPIAFCWTEKAKDLGSLAPQEWQTVGIGGKESNEGRYLVKGLKHKVLYDSSTENFLVFFKDKLLSDRFKEETHLEEPNPASDAFIGCCFIPKSQVKIGPVYTDALGSKFVDIEIDTVVEQDQMVFYPKRLDPTALNIKALGQVASSAVVLGMLKDCLRRTYKHLFENKYGLLKCDIIERKLATVTSKIYAIESMVYYIAGMFDGLQEGFDAHLESIILKISTNEFAYEILQELQQVCGSEMLVTSRIQDQINSFDAFLDGNIYNRLYLSIMGVFWYSRGKNIHLNRLRLAPWYPGYFVRSLFKEKLEQSDMLTLDADIYGSLHPSLKEAGVNLEYVLKRVSYATEDICRKHGENATAAQSSLYRLSQLSIDAFMLSVLCARASKSYCSAVSNADVDVALATIFSNDIAKRVRYYMDEINMTPLTTIDSQVRIINELNIKRHGYYAETPLDPNI